MRRPSLPSVILLTTILLLATTARSDWDRFRGPNGSGVCEDSKPVPTRFGESENFLWKVALPGPGSSSPILVGQRLYITCWSGYGMDPENPGDPKELRRHLLCLDRGTGKTIWSRTVEPALPEDEFGGMFAQHGYASHTPVSDGERIYVHFGKAGALAFDMEGNRLWQQDVGTELDPHKWGSASSPILYGGLVIVTATAESEALVGLDKKTGEEVWRQEAAGFNGVWGTPVLVKVDASRSDLVIAVPNEIWGFNPETGKLRWFARTFNGTSFCSSPVTKDGIVYAMESGPQGGGGIAVRAGGQGDVTDTHVVWAGRQSNRIGTPIIHRNRLYCFSGGIVGCFDLENGKEVSKGRLGSTGGDSESDGEDRRQAFMRMDYSSPVVAGEHIYFASRRGTVHVLKTGDEFEQVAANLMTTDNEDFSASPAVSDGQLFLRSDKHLYCIANVPGSKRVVAKKTPSAEPAEEKTVAASESEGRGRGPGGRRPGGRGPGGAGGDGGGGFDPVAFFKRMDQDGDDKLTGDEIAGPMKDNLAQIDTDKDQSISLEEFRAGMRQAYSRGNGGGRERRDPRAGRPERPKRPEMEVVATGEGSEGI